MILQKDQVGNIAIFALTGYTKSWIVLKDNGYKILAYDENGKECEAWLNTDVSEEEPIYLNSLGLSKFNCTVLINGKERSGNTNLLWHSRNNYVNDGIYNRDRNCYYPKDLSNNRNIAERNKIEKLFKKWGFKSL